MAGRGGLEPPLRGPEPRVLPLDDLPASKGFYRRVINTVKARGSPAAGQPRICSGPASVSPSPGEDGALERAARLEPRHATGRQLDRLARAGIAAVALGAPADQEGAEAGDRDPTALAEGGEHPVHE